MELFPSFYTLNNNLKCPVIGQGTADIGNINKISEVIYNSIKNGSRLIDTASIYNSEEGIGLGLKKYLKKKFVKEKIYS